MKNEKRIGPDWTGSAQLDEISDVILYTEYGDMVRALGALLSADS